MGLRAFGGRCSKQERVEKVPWDFNAAPVHTSGKGKRSEKSGVGDSGEEKV